MWVGYAFMEPVCKGGLDWGYLGCLDCCGRNGGVTWTDPDWDYTTPWFSDCLPTLIEAEETYHDCDECCATSSAESISLPTMLSAFIRRAGSG